MLTLLEIIRLPASLIAGYLYDNVNSGAPFYFGSAMALLATILIIVFTIVNRKSIPVINVSEN